MNTQQWMSLLRSVLIAAGSGLGFTAIMTPEKWTALSNAAVAIIGGVVTAIPIICGVMSKTNAGLIKAAASVPEVKKITVEPEVAEKVDSSKVSGARS